MNFMNRLFSNSNASDKSVACVIPSAPTLVIAEPSVNEPPRISRMGNCAANRLGPGGLVPMFCVESID